ncbi:MAG: CtsR family transcriptional regulator [Phascolarctobacterium sp.]|nr:CtsR family transcriptional regulator [Phascolarctobacterium sp.]
MRNLADAIESFIIGELLRDQEDALLVQRNELAERMSCAPSQISYVLSTRFTPERGYLVESRRGSGGFVRIVRMEPKAQVAKHKEPTANELVEHVQQQKLITVREAALLKFMLHIIDADESKKKSVLQQAMNVLASQGRG